jgi:xanthine/CO dehydrogenase XdhC/CoxF family maturation factor
MGCRGIVRVLLEPIQQDHILIRTFQTVFDYRWRQCMATIISSSRAVAGGRVFYSAIEQFDFENLPNEIERLDKLKNDLLAFFRSNKAPEVRHYELGDDTFELFFENINPPLNLLVFGAGFDALPLARFAKELGWRVTVIDHRAAFANAERLPEADEIIVSRAEDLPKSLFKDENSVAVMMTHNYERDHDILYKLLNSNCRYIGALGPKLRTEKLIAEIRAEGKTFNEWNLENLHAPVGLDIGAETPEEIALAVVAEIKTALSNRGGGFLRERQGAIND